jgi:hypothetical protein
MKKTLLIPVLCMLLILVMGAAAQAQPVAGCDRTVAQRLDTARALVTIDALNYSDVVNYWAEDAVHYDPMFLNSDRAEVWSYLQALFGWRPDMVRTITDELFKEHPDGSATYMATIKWSGDAEFGYYRDPGMSIVKFDPGEGCASYHRDYFSEGDVWWSQTAWQPNILMLRTMYIQMFGLSGRCFDDDGDGYTKYAEAAGCPNAGLDCNDYLPEVNPGAAEIYENGIDDDCNPGTADTAPPCSSSSVVEAEYKGPADLAVFLLFLFAPLGAVLVWRGLRRKQ